MDTTPLESDLLRHRAFLLRLAASLVGGNDADDLAQDVWLRALEHPRSGREHGRAWLARIAHNLAVNRFRARGRRQQRERDAARPEAISAAVGELDERLELGQELASAVRALDEPYRAVILLRFFEGLSHAEIAARLALPIATVRTRQQRALARLRERLDRGQGGREAWSATLAAWVARQTASGAAGLGGGFAGGLGAAVAAAVLVGAALGAWLWMRAPVEGTVLSKAAPALVQSPPANPQDFPAPANPATARRASTATLAPAAKTLLVGRVVGLSSAELRAAHVGARAVWKRYAIDAPPAHGVLRDDGSFEIEVGDLLGFSDEPVDELVAELDHPLHLRSSSVVAGSSGALQPSGDTLFDAGELVARDAAVVTGSVRMPDGTPAAEAWVLAYFLDQGGPREDSVGRTRCDGEGRFDLRMERGGECLLAFLVENVRPSSVDATARLGSAVELPTTTLESGYAIAGRVTRLGHAMPQAEVTVANPARFLDGTGGSGIGWLDGRVEWSDRRIESDSEGRFQCHGLAPAAYSVSVEGPARASSLGFEREASEISAPCADVELEFRASLVTLERTPESPPEIEGNIRVTRAGAEDFRFSFRRADAKAPTMLVAPPSTPLSLSIELQGVPPIALEIVTPGPGEELLRTVAYSSDLSPHSSPGPLSTLELEWIPDPKLSIGAFRVHFESPDGVAILSRSVNTSDAVDGVFRITDVPPGRYRVRIHAGWDHLFENLPALDGVLSVELAPGATTRQRFALEPGGILRVDVRAASGERCAARFQLLDADGATLNVQFQTTREGTWLSETWILKPWAEHTSEPLPVGDYTLVLWNDDLAEQRVPVRIVAGEITALGVTLEQK